MEEGYFEMNADTLSWSRRYQAALRKQLSQRQGTDLASALRLGRQAVSLGLETLDVARSHEKVLMTLAAPDDSARTRQSLIKRATLFFSKTIIPIEKTHLAALTANARIDQLNRTLIRRTTESSVSQRRLKRSIRQRRGAEKAMKKSGKHHSKLMAESRNLQAHLRHLTHTYLWAQENKRKSISRQLQDEIAQTLLGINIRLLTLKKTASNTTKHLKKEIANTQQVVKESVQGINRFAHEFVIKK